MREVTYGSLFSGIGGMDLGLEMASDDEVKFVCKWQVERDSYAKKVLEKHWPQVARFDDVRECGSGNLEPVDIILGGFPCVDISYAGKGAGLEGERSGLWFEFARIIREMGPRVAVVENVSALLTRGIDQVLGAMASFGFDAQWHCIPAASVGAPHIRDRVFVIAGARLLGDTDCSRRVRWSARGGDGCKTRRSMLAEGCNDVSDTNSPRLEGHRQFTSGTLTEFKNTCHSRWWETEPDVGRVADGISKRVDRLRCLGNAVVPQVMQYIGEHIREQFFKD